MSSTHSEGEMDLKPDISPETLGLNTPPPTSTSTSTKPSKKSPSKPTPPNHSIKSELIGTLPPSPSKPKRSSKSSSSPKKPSGGSTNLAMAAEVVKHALSLINGDEIKIVAEKLGADPIKLRDSWRKNWYPRAIKAADAEFGNVGTPK